MTYEQTLDYLFTKLPLFSRVGAPAYKKDLNNTVKLCAALGDPQNKFRSIHIAGTNGKGSTSHMLAATLQQAGYKTGLYTSPHLKDFRERIRINGKMISKDFVVEFVEKIKTISEEIEPSFFELTVAMAFEYFVTEKIDIAVIETGLGGRLDSTNIITPVLSVITNIGYDHQNILGNSLEEIASEKAGIIKKKVPVVIGETTNITKEIFLKKAASENSPAFFAEEIFHVKTFEQNAFDLKIEVEAISSQKLLKISSDLNGIYQQKNICTVLAATHVLRKQGFVIPDTIIQNALSNVKTLTGLRGRWDVIHEKPMVVLDVAHNEDGLKQLLKQLELLQYKRLHIVFGMVKDKDPAKILPLLPKAAHYYFTNASIPRALAAQDLQQYAAEFHLKGKVISDVTQAVATAITNAAANDLVLVCGSIFVVAEVDAGFLDS